MNCWTKNLKGTLALEQWEKIKSAYSDNTLNELQTRLSQRISNLYSKQI
jgi:recombination DNA repair RAD52 pathway protein